MAQSEATVTVVSPSPPTNMLSVFGGSPPTTDGLPFTDDGTAGALNTVTAPTNGTPHEATGSIVTVTAPGSRTECPTQMLSDLGNYTATPNGSHATASAPAVAPTITALTPSSPASGASTLTLVVTGTNFRPSSYVTLNGVPYPTQYTSPTELKVFNAPRKATAGNVPVSVVTGGTAIAPTSWTFT